MAVSSPCGTLQNIVFKIFDLGPLTPKIYSPNLHKFAYHSACMADRPEMFGPTRVFSGMADSMEPCKMLWADPCCRGNEIWARRGDPVAYRLVIITTPLEQHVYLCDLSVGYDGIPEFVPALLELIQSKLAGSEKNAVKLEKASSFYLPPICGNHAELVAKPEKVLPAEDCLKLTTGAPHCGDNNSSFDEPLCAGNGFKSHHNDVSNGTV